MSSPAEIRAARRRAKILDNSEDRMKKIFGGENFHQDHLTAPSAVPNDIDSIPAAQYTGGGQHRTSMDAGKSRETAAVRAQAAPVVPPVFWVILGILVRAVTKFSMLPVDFFVIFALTFGVCEFLSPRSAPTSAMMGIVLKLSGVNAAMISRLVYIYGLFTNAVNCFLLYFYPFVIYEIVFYLIQPS